MKIKIHIKKINGFTLIELLVVVAIIGILAAVGVVAYSGYTSSAKKNTAKNNHSIIVKYISNNLSKCDLDGGMSMASGVSKVYVEEDPEEEGFGEDVSEEGSLECEDRHDEDVVDEAVVDALGAII